MLWILSLAVFSITLVITKSKILACKRRFVEERYRSSKGDGQPNWFHVWWHAMWTCPMCSGFWVALIVCFFYPVKGWVLTTLAVFGLNWILHCTENAIFGIGEFFEKDESEDSPEEKN